MRVPLTAMRRAPGMLLVLFVSMLWPATALGVDGDGETTFTVPLKGGNGLSVKFEADDDEIELTVRKREGGQFVVYSAPGKVSPEGVTVDFGRFGEFVADYEPFRTLQTREPNKHCVGEPRTTTEGYFRGTIRLIGERGYFRIEATRVKGTLVHVPERECDFGSVSASRAPTREGDGEAALTASSPHDRIQFLAGASRKEDERPYAYFFATSAEVQEGVGIVRFTYARSRSAGFEFDHQRGSAFLDPPAPFAGSAHFKRRAKARDDWSGSLTAPLLGLGRVRLASPEFRAHLSPELPGFE